MVTHKRWPGPRTRACYYDEKGLDMGWGEAPVGIGYGSDGKDTRCNGWGGGN